MPDLDLGSELAGWPVGSAAVAIIGDADVLASAGNLDTTYQWASVTKILTALTVLTSAQGSDLDEPAGPPGATVRHLLAHASGLAFDSDATLAPPGRRRIYSNRGYEAAAEHAARRAAEAFPELLQRHVLGPLGMSATSLQGSPAADARGSVRDLTVLAGELLRPRVLSTEVVAAATTTAFPGLSGLLPGFGRQEHNDWALGCEVRDHKSPHWTAPDNSPATFGHFGRAGGFLWVDPDAAVACVSLSDTDFGAWSQEAWPRLSARVLQAYSR